MAVDDYPSGLNARRHQNKLGTAINNSGTGGPRRRPANPRKWSTPRRFIFGRPSPLALLRYSRWRIRFTSQLTSCCSRMTLLQPEGMADKRINPVIPGFSIADSLLFDLL